MIRTDHHPNTQTLLSAWARMDQSSEQLDESVRASDHPDLLECLFVIEESEEGRWLFRNAGDQLETLLGRALGEHDSLALWRGHDRTMVESLIASVRESRKPGILAATGETLTGTQVDIELTLAPLPSPLKNASQNRLLGLYQILQPAPVLGGRPVWRHRVTAIYPPAIDRQPAQLRLVANND